MFAFCSFIEQQNKSDHMRASAFISPAVTYSLCTHHEPHGSVMPVRSPGEQPARPTPEAAAPPPSPVAHLLQIPEALPQRTRPCKEGGGVRPRFISFRERAPVQSLSVQVSLCEWLCHSALSGTSHSTQPPRSLQHRSTLTAWETQTEKEEGGGERRVLLSCSLTVLFVRPFLWPVHYRGNSWVYVNPRTASLFCNTQTHISQILTSVISRTESRIEAGNRVWTGARMSCERQQWKHYKTYCHRHANTQRVKRDTDAEVRATRV